jgi:hypothetical protein
LTLVDPRWTKVSGRHTTEGVLFVSYRIGISRYTRVSQDGAIRLDQSPYHAGVCAEVLGHGWIKGDGVGDRAKRFRSEQTAVRAALKIIKGAT